MKRTSSERARYRTQRGRGRDGRKLKGRGQAEYRNEDAYLTKYKRVKYDCSVYIILHATVEAGGREAFKVRKDEFVIGCEVTLH